MDSAATKPLAVLALATFGIGTTEFVIMGLLPDMFATSKKSWRKQPGKRMKHLE
jgi:predicted MFS family arabinose efflux permease